MSTSNARRTSTEPEPTIEDLNYLNSELNRLLRESETNITKYYNIVQECKATILELEKLAQLNMSYSKIPTLVIQLKSADEWPEWSNYLKQ
jgi:hypothetical protein